MSRSEFSKATKQAELDDSKGFCRCCEMPIVGTPEFDHICPDALYGKNDLDNCQVLCKKCHKRKTKLEDRPKIDKATRLKEKAAGIRGPKRKWPSRKFNGDIS